MAATTATSHFELAPGYRELDAGGAAAMHAKWSPRIACAVREIHAGSRTARRDSTIEVSSHSKRAH